MPVSEVCVNRTFDNTDQIRLAENMDAAATNMLKTWFPKEVSEKDKENESDRKKEELKELGLEEANCVIT